MTEKHISCLAAARAVRLLEAAVIPPAKDPKIRRWAFSGTWAAEDA